MTHLERGELASALSQWLRVWGIVRSPRLAGPILKLGQLTHRVLPIAEVSDPTRWLAMASARNPADVDRLLVYAATRTPDDATHRDAKKRFDRLRERPPDPRTTRLIERWAVPLPSAAASGRIAWTAFFRLVEYTGDVRALRRLDALQDAAQASLDAHADPRYAEFERYILDRLPKTRERIEAHRPEVEVPDGLQEPLERVEALLRPLLDGGAPPRSTFLLQRDRDLEALHRAVLEAPEDPGPLQVWADALQEADDPRGRFVALQLAREHGPLDPDTRQEARELRDAHVNRWLGPLDAVVHSPSARFRRGLLYAARVRFRQHTRLIGHRGWRTVERLQSSIEHLLHPNLVCLRHVGMRLVEDLDHASRTADGAGDHRLEAFTWHPGAPVLAWNGMCALANRSPRPLESLTFALPRTEPRAAQLDAVRDAEALPTLNTVHLVDTWSDERRYAFGRGGGRLGPLHGLCLLERARLVIYDNLLLPDADHPDSVTGHSGLDALRALHKPGQDGFWYLHDTLNAEARVDGNLWHLVLRWSSADALIPAWFRRQDAARARAMLATRLHRLLPDPARWATIRVAVPALPSDAHTVLAAHLAPCSDVLLPPASPEPSG